MPLPPDDDGLSGREEEFRLCRAFRPLLSAQERQEVIAGGRAAAVQPLIAVEVINTRHCTASEGC